MVADGDFEGSSRRSTRSTRAWRPRLLSLTRSPTLMPFGMWAGRWGRSLVGTRGVGDHGGVELFGELAAGAGMVVIGVALDLLCGGLVVDGFDDLAKLIRRSRR